MSETDPEGWTAVSVGVDKYNVSYDGVIVFDLPRAAVPAVGYQLIERAKLRRQRWQENEAHEKEVEQLKASLAQANLNTESADDDLANANLRIGMLEQAIESLRSCLRECRDNIGTFLCPHGGFNAAVRDEWKTLVARADAILAGEADPMAARLAELEEAVARLPKTKDGVPVWIGSIVWWNDPDTEEPVELMVADEYPRREWVRWDETSDCYSTREAAEAALKGGAK